MNKRAILQEWFNEVGINVNFTLIGDRVLVADVSTLNILVEHNTLQPSQIRVVLPFLDDVEHESGENLRHFSSSYIINLADPDCWYTLSEILDKGFDADVEWFSTDEW